MPKKKNLDNFINIIHINENLPYKSDYSELIIYFYNKFVKNQYKNIEVVTRDSISKNLTINNITETDNKFILNFEENQDNIISASVNKIPIPTADDKQGWEDGFLFSDKLRFLFDYLKEYDTKIYIINGFWIRTNRFLYFDEVNSSDDEIAFIKNLEQTFESNIYYLLVPYLIELFVDMKKTYKDNFYIMKQNTHILQHRCEDFTIELIDSINNISSNQEKYNIF